MTKFLLFTLVVLGCANPKKISYPFEFIDSKTEMVESHVNRMDLYFSDEKIAIDSLKMFCQEQKQNWDEGMFYLLVVFDSKPYATFPNNPLTSLYSDEVRMRHIKAVYSYNRLNGISRLSIYPDNMWETPPMQIGI